MDATPSTKPLLALVVAWLVIAAGTWRWQATVRHADQEAAMKDETWGRVKDEYPIPVVSASAPMISQELVDAIIRANPFSPKRRFVVPPPEPGSGGSAGPIVSEAAAPKFVYKGRIDLGKRQRAIVENLTTHKTYFLEVGQEVAGFKVLDIAQNQVVLSDPSTHGELVVSLKSPSSEKSAEP